MNTLNNSVRLIGHVGGDPEVKQLESGKKFARFSLATKMQFMNSLGDKVEKTHWHNVIFWNRSAEVVEKYVRKGTHLSMEGLLTYHSWEDDKGTKRYQTQVAGRELLLL